MQEIWEMDVDFEANGRQFWVKQEYDLLCLFLTKLNWIVAPTGYISRFGFGPQFGCLHVQVLLSIDQMSGLVDIRREERRL